MASSLRSWVFTLLMVALVHGIGGHTLGKRRAEKADELRMENELRRVKRLQEHELSRMKRVQLQNSVVNGNLYRVKRSLGPEPDLSRVKRMRRHLLPVQAFLISTDQRFDPGLSRVKRMKRSPNPIKTKRFSEPSLARMKRIPYFDDEIVIPRMKRNGRTGSKHHKKMSKRGHDLRHIKSMNPRLRKVLKERAKQRRLRKKNYGHNKMFQTHRGVSPPIKHRSDSRSGHNKPRSHHHVQHHRRSDEKKPRRISKRM